MGILRSRSTRSGAGERAIIPVQSGGGIYRIFNQYGDSQEARELATAFLRNVLRFYYGDAYQYIFFGTSVQNGLITKSFVDVYNNARTGGLSVSQAMATIESGGYVKVSFVKTENPRYEYPWYYEYRILPYSIVDRFEFFPLSIKNLKFNGCKLTGTGINANSTETTDGGPVVKVTVVNQNQIVFSNNNITTARANTSGLPVRQLTSRDIAAGAGTISRNTTGISL